MRVLVAGATGAIGRPLLPRLMAAGHDVTGLTRSAERADALRAQGVSCLVVDALDAPALRAAVLAAEPEVVVNQLTALPRRIDPRHYAQALEPTSRLRREAAPVLAAAAAEAGARRIIAQSVAFMLAPEGPWVRDEDAPIWLDPPATMREAAVSTLALERATLDQPGIEGVVLRYGFLYGPGAAYAADGSIAQDVRRRRMPVIGSGEGRFSFIHVEDAADATVLALTRGAPGVYHVTDDAPALQRDWVRAIAQDLGAPRPLRIPRWLARLGAGPMADGAVQLRGASNAKARRELGWEPARPDWRAGFRAEFAAAG